MNEQREINEAAVGQSEFTAGLCCNSARRIKALVSLQAEDDGIWFHAETCAEAYLQERMRDLHAAIEAEFGAT